MMNQAIETLFRAHDGLLKCLQWQSLGGHG